MELVHGFRSVVCVCPRVDVGVSVFVVVTLCAGFFSHLVVPKSIEWCIGVHCV